MEQQVAVKKMMLMDIKQNPSIPPEAYPAIQDALTWMFQIGYEHRTFELSHPTRVGQYTIGGKFIREYQSLSHAARAVDATADNIQKVANGRKGYITAKGYVWKYMDKITDNNDKPEHV